MVQNRAVDDAILNFTKAIRNAADAAIPKISNFNRKLCKPWWNASCQQALSGGSPSLVPGGAWMGSCIAERGAVSRPLLIAESRASPAKLVL
ncbi:hypothetical protein TNCV_1495061 [Trichonephila clavipes]|nr:hypothetical protein TNCV_1495061 [Trichonephila clavipes]